MTTQRRLTLTAIAIFLFEVSVGVASAQQYTIRDHGLECEQKIGPIPPFSCLDGELIPITRDGVEIPDNAHQAHQKCDRPPLLGLGMASSQGQCVPFSRVGNLPGRNAAGQDDANIQWAFICRRYRVRTDKNYPNFEDVAIVGHNRATGATCFFQTLRYQGGQDGIDATRVPPPAEAPADTPAGKIKAADFWYTPQQTANIGCYTCHDSDPFIHTPHVSQVKKNGKEVVPPGPDLAAVPPDKTRYKHVGQPFEQGWPTLKRIRPLGNGCTTCHNIGMHRTCDRFARIAAGIDSPSYITDFGKHFPRSHWMPPDVESSGMTLSTWKSVFEASVNKILSCCASPGTASCRLTDFDN
jgi:hypothetical protein